MKKRVAIITRTKNRPILLPRVRESLHSQTYKDFIWVLVNDAGVREPVDHEANLAREKGMEVLVVHREESVGMEAASNDGVKKSSSEYIVIHDDDDTWEPQFLEKTVNFLENDPRYVGVITHSMRIVERLTDKGAEFLASHPYNDWLTSVFLIDLAQTNRFPPISYLFRRSLYDDVHGFDESLPVLGDWDFNLRSLAVGDVAVIPELLANYHFRYDVHDNGYSNSVVGGIDKHAQYDPIYRNRMLRDDMKNGRVGIGHLINIGRLYGHIEHNFRKQDRYFSAVDKFLAVIWPRWLRKILRKSQQ